MNKHHASKIIIPFLIITLVIVPKILHAASFTLAWDANREDDLLGYKIYYGTSPDNYDSSVYVGNVTSYKLSELKDGIKYYIVITAIDTNLNESNFSREITTKICFSGIIFITISPFISAIYPCIDYTSKENRFTLMQEDSSVLNQKGEFNQNGSKFYATCEYNLDILGEIKHHFWTFDGYILSNLFISGNLTLEITSDRMKMTGIGIFMALRF